MRARAALDESDLKRLKERAKFYGLDKSKDFDDFKKKYLAIAESEKQYGIRYGEHAIDVDKEYIHSQEYLEKFDNISDNPALNESIYNTTVQVLERRSGTQREEMYLFNENDGSVFAKITDSPRDEGIIYTKEFEEKLQEHIDHNIPIVALHNHPQGTPPSSDDFRKAYENQYSFGIVIGHNGQLYRYETPKEKVSKVLSDAIASDIGGMTSGGDSVK